MAKVAVRPADQDLPRITAGDIVRTGENRHPHYRVITVCGDRAWVRDIQYGTDHIIPIARLHHI